MCLKLRQPDPLRWVFRDDPPNPRTRLPVHVTRYYRFGRVEGRENVPES